MKNLADHIRALEGIHSAGILFVSSSAQEEFVTYDSLFQESRRCMNGLLSVGIRPNEYLILDLNQKLDFFITYNACILAGIIPVPLSAEDSLSFQKVANVFRELGEPILITDTHKKDDYLKTPAFSRKEDKVIGYGELRDVELHVFADVVIDQVCFVQFSSGSTGTPKGVELTHKNILTNVFDIANSHDLCEEDVALSWMPHTHDMGLIGQYIVYIVHQTQQIHISPITFIRKPNLFLRLLQDHGVTITSSPNFGLTWLIKNVDKKLFHEGSLKKVRIIINGAEPISAKVLAEFQSLFGGMGLREEAMNPSYGLAEASVGVTFSNYLLKYEGILVNRDDYQRMRRITVTSESCDTPSETGIAMISVGVPLPSVELRIVNDTHNECAESDIGEILIKGDNVTRGYTNGEISKELFLDGWLRTGDLGFLYKENLYVCGRKKDLICVNGKNFFSSDLEAEIHDLGTFTSGDLVVSSAIIEGEERLLLFLKAKRIDEAFIENVQNAMALLQGTTGERISSCVPLKAIPKTTSGKLQRSRLVERFSRGDYQSESDLFDGALAEFRNRRHREKPQTDNEKLLHRIWSEVLSVEPDNLGITDEFFNIGGTSILAVEMLGLIEQQFDTEFGHDILIQSKSIRDMATYIENFTPNDAPEKRWGKPTGKESDHDHDIAITGVGIRMPGARDPDELWSIFRNGQSAIQRISTERLSQLQAEPELIAFLGELTPYDVLDYHQDVLKKNELDWIDPHQKLLLNCSQDALQDGEVDLTSDLDIGVYIAASQSSFVETVLEKIKQSESIPPGALVGSILNTYAARISNLYDFRGPSMVLDTACSAGLVAVNYALEDLKSNRISSALVGGANLVLGTSQIKLFRAAGIMSKRGQCSVFGSEADGIVVGEGAIVIHLEKLSKARKKNKKIYGVIKACSINNNGKTLGIMAPRPEGQIAVMKNAFLDSKITPDSIGYFEVHGTGTVLGDPIEINSLKKAFSGYGDSGRKCRLGSSKSNFGHLLAASGLIGLLRATLSLYYKEISPCINADTINQSIDIENSPFEIPKKLCEWDADITRRACVNSFGFGGTNAHVILEENGLQ